MVGARACRSRALGKQSSTLLQAPRFASDQACRDVPGSNHPSEGRCRLVSPRRAPDRLLMRRSPGGMRPAAASLSPEDVCGPARRGPSRTHYPHELAVRIVRIARIVRIVRIVQAKNPSEEGEKRPCQPLVPAPWAALVVECDAGTLAGLLPRLGGALARWCAGKTRIQAADLHPRTRPAHRSTVW